MNINLPTPTGRNGVDWNERGGCSSLTPQTDWPHDHVKADSAREVHPPGEPADVLLLRPSGGETIKFLLTFKQLY